jgi:uncharacterized protein (DUF885 family)
MTLRRRDLLCGAAAAGAAAVSPPAWAAPGLGAVLDTLAGDYLNLYPEQATSYGYDKGARSGLKSRLADRSLAGVKADGALCVEGLAALAAVPDAGLSAQDRLNKAVALYALQLGREGQAFAYGDNTLFSAMNESATPYVVSQASGAFAQIPEFLDSQHAIGDIADADAYLQRMTAFAVQLDQERGRIERDFGHGVIAPDFILDNTIGQQMGLLATPPAQARVVQSLARRTRAFPDGARYEAMAERIAEREIYPALRRQLDSLKACRAKAGSDAGVWRLPDGEAYYRWCLKAGTSTDLDAAAIHQMGLDQIQALDARMETILRANGLTEGSVGARMTALGKDPKYLFPDTDAGRVELIDYLNGIIAAVRPRLSEAFTLNLKAPVLVKRVPVDIQDGAGQGYMNFGSVDGSRPSIYYINLKTTANWPKFSLPDLTYHETVPGHAWQGAYLTETGKLPKIRILLSGFNAYVEGWALYAEQLADEIGMYDADWAGRLGYLTGLKFRAIRLVVDTGLHAMRWTREQAIQWAMDNSGRTRNAMTSEIDRYCAWPGQACGYKIGQTEIVRLRTKTQTALGAGFDKRAYNDLIVKTGPVPLTVLAGVVDDFIAAGGKTGL